MNKGKKRDCRLYINGNSTTFLYIYKKPKYFPELSTPAFNETADSVQLVCS